MQQISKAYIFCININDNINLKLRKEGFHLDKHLLGPLDYGDEQVWRAQPRCAMHADDPQRRKAADEELNQLKKVAGFRSCLLVIVTTQSLTLQQRLLGALALKNNISNYFGLVLQKRTPEQVAAQDKEKELLKSQLLSCLEEPENRLAIVITAVIALIATFQWPRNWPSLFPTLVQHIQTGSNLLSTRALYTLHQVQKKLAKKRMTMSRLAFVKASEALLPLLKGMWTTTTKTFMMGLQSLFKAFRPPAPLQPSPQQLAPLEASGLRAVLTLKCLHRVVVLGVPDPDVNPHIQELFTAFLSLLPSLQQVRARLPLSSLLHKHVSKIMRVMVRTILELQVAQPLRFRKFLVAFCKCFEQVLRNSVDKQGNLTFEQCTVLCLTFFHKVVSCPQYSGAGSKVGASFSADRGIQFDAQAVEDAQRTLLSFFTPTQVKDLAQLVLTKLLPLRPEDLQRWRIEPEVYRKEESSLKAEEKARPAAQALLKSLMTKFQQLLAPLVLQLLQEVVRKPASDLPSLLKKEAVFHAVGIGSDILGPEFKKHNFDFSQLYTRCLANELASTAEVQRITRRRIIWVVGEYALQVPDALRNPIYQQIRRLLEESDLVVRLDTAEALRALVSNLQFDTTRDVFVPHGQALLERLFKLINDSTELDSKQNVMILISQIVEKLGPAAKNLCGCILKYMPAIWDASANSDSSLVRVPMLSLLTSLVAAAGPDSPQLHGFVLPLLDKSVRPTGPLIYLQEGALDLWLTVIKQAPKYTDSLHELFGHWLLLQQGGTLHLQVLISLLESYLLLGQLAFMRSHAKTVCSAINSMISSGDTNPTSPFAPASANFISASIVLDDQGLATVMAVVEPFAQLFPEQTLTGFEPILCFVIGELVQESVYQAKQNNSSSNNNNSKEGGARPAPARSIERNGVFSQNADGKYDASGHHAVAGPAHVSRPDSVLAVYFTLFGRLVLQAYGGTMRLLAAAAQGKVDPGELLAVIIDVWLDKIDAMKAQYQKRLACLGLVSLLGTNNRAILRRLSGILYQVVGVLGEEAEESAQSKQLRAQQIAQAQAVLPARRTELERLRLMAAADPAEQLSLRDYSLQKLRLCRQRCGDSGFAEVLQSVDNRIMQDFRRLARPDF
eukprot:g82632.t1